MELFFEPADALPILEAHALPASPDGDFWLAYRKGIAALTYDMATSTFVVMKIASGPRGSGVRCTASLERVMRIVPACCLLGMQLDCF